MKKNSVILIVIVAVILIFGVWMVAKYNGLVKMEEGVKSQWSNVENVYQRRMDLIPNLVNTVKGYAAHEKEALQSVVEARAKATQLQINPSDAASMQKFEATQNELSSSLSRLMMVVERYPDLKANQNFLELQAQLEGTENRISTERRKFNEKAQNYNTYRRRFPNNIIAGMFNFEEKTYFKAQDQASTAPKVEF